MAEVRIVEENSLVDFKKVPKTPGIYRFLGKKDQPLYIGKAKNLNSRLKSYFFICLSKLSICTLPLS